MPPNLGPPAKSKDHNCPIPVHVRGRAHLLDEVLDNAVLRHLGADGKAALELLLYAAQHLLVLLAGEALHPWEGRGQGPRLREGTWYQGTARAKDSSSGKGKDTQQPRKLREARAQGISGATLARLH